MKMPMYGTENPHVDNNNGSNNNSIAPPFSQTVGREFVRQYYTMFGSGPKYVHRFYGSQSIFVRDEIEVVGQHAIEKQIEMLHLKDCHTKIRAVDSHSTIGDGFVVQVIGEISINGSSFRNFVQTFVLAPQSDKKYYVHNDTFRFLDSCLSEGHNPAIHDNVSEVDVPFCAGESSSSLLVSPPIVAPSGEGPPLNHSSAEHFHDLQGQIAPSFENSNELVCANGNGEHPPSADKTNVDTAEEMDQHQNGECLKQQSTWASRVGSKTCVGGGGGGYTQQPGSFPTIQSSQAVIPGQTLVNKIIPTSCASDGFKPPAPPSTIHAGNGVRPIEPNRTSTSAVGPLPQRNGNYRSGSKLYDQNFSIEQQVFIGNLPMEVSDKELHERLHSFGKILNVSVVAKPATSPYAFVTFESPESVVKLLESQINMPNSGIFIRNNRITIEKKRGIPNDGRYQQNHNDSMNTGPQRIGNMNQRGPPMLVSRMPYGTTGRGAGPFTRPPVARTFRSNIQVGNQYAGGGGNMMPK